MSIQEEAVIYAQIDLKVMAAVAGYEGHTRILTAIYSMIGKNGTWTASIEEILKRVNGFSRRGKKLKDIKPKRASQIIRDLVKWECLDARRSGYGRPNTYAKRTPSDVLPLEGCTYVPTAKQKTTLSRTPEIRDNAVITDRKRDMQSRNLDATHYRSSWNAIHNKEKKDPFKDPRMDPEIEEVLAYMEGRPPRQIGAA